MTDPQDRNRWESLWDDLGLPPLVQLGKKE